MASRIKKFATIFIILAAICCLLFPTYTVLAEFGIEPGKVFVDNLFPGAEADITISVYNQGDSEVNYAAAPRPPDYTAEGYEPLPYLDWITVTPANFSIKGGGKQDLLVVLKMPEDADYSGKKAEIWISIKESSPKEMIQIELPSRILISTRDEDAAVPTTTPTTPATTTEPTEPGEIVISTPEPENPSGNQKSILAPVLGGLAGVIIVGEGIYFVIKRRRKAAGAG